VANLSPARERRSDPSEPVDTFRGSVVELHLQFPTSRVGDRSGDQDTSRRGGGDDDPFPPVLSGSPVAPARAMTPGPSRRHPTPALCPRTSPP